LPKPHDCGSAYCWGALETNQSKGPQFFWRELGGRDCIPSEGLVGAPILRRGSGGNASSPPSHGDWNSYRQGSVFLHHGRTEAPGTRHPPQFKAAEES
jgi:hypothetical protein